MKSNTGFWILAATGCATVVHASKPPEAATPLAFETPGLGTAWLFLALVVILAAAALLQKRYGLRTLSRGQGALRMIASLPLGEKRAIVMVEADEERMLVGITSQSVQLISRLKPADEKQESDYPAPPGVGDSRVFTGLARETRRFRSFLRAAMHRGGHE